MKTKPRRTCPRCGNRFSGAMEFCPVCMVREAIDFVTKDKDMSAQRFQPESIAHQSIETFEASFEAFAHVSGSQGQIDPGYRSDSRHGLCPGKTTLIVTTSAPWSADTRFAEGSWIAAWLAGLKVPLEQ
jgi:hypothetical protein